MPHSQPFDDVAEGRRRNIGGALFFGAFTAFLAGCLGLCVYETYALATTEEPITQRTRYTLAKYPTHSMIACLGLGALLGHLLWGPADNGREFFE